MHTGEKRRSPAGNTKFGAKLSQIDIENPYLSQQVDHIVLAADCDDEPKESFTNIQAQIRDWLAPQFVPNAPLARTNTKPSYSVLMLPWHDSKGNLECLLSASLERTDRMVSGHVENFLAMCGVDKWDSPSMRGKAKLRAAIAVRIKQDPSITIGDLFKDRKLLGHIDINHKAVDQVVNFLSAF